MLLTSRLVEELCGNYKNIFHMALLVAGWHVHMAFAGMVKLGLH